jgi:UDP-N-acetylmuramoyl-tripeptide--D-alanyl-D-alanine ligase
MRMQLVNGAQDILFINDAYNAAPTSMKAALQFLQTTEMRSDKWVVLGDMLELGELEQQYHEEIAEVIDGKSIHKVCLFGPRMKWLYDKLENNLPADHLLWTAEDYETIIQHLRTNAGPNSIVLLKGSRGMELENILNAFKE